ncbi:MULTISPECIES: SDR family oxidoreductase [Streptomyces]|uniref:SDR family oxidoreductase n=1 Tax=Streptomyces lycii TaxID=2654337 RepID=A0ABQ7FG70_9ACTN|nr:MULTISPECIES: SDR family oxidoreductase [Streptomyces]KAF4406836.1 SDR family oxidoreductase [Streptomyces lycii]PGH47454.1 NAD(P)-dependent oxidoreductase [Streptomyces sp. Ru87]
MQENDRGPAAEPQITSEPRPPYTKQRQRPPGLERDMEPRPRYRAARYRAAGKLRGKVALITGGDSGIGRAVAVLYAREGADVAVTHLPEEQPDAEETRRAVEAEGRTCLLLAGDLAEESFCRQSVERTVRGLGGLNILVNNAAHLNSQTDLSQLSSADWHRSFQVNVYAYYHLVQAARPHLTAGDAIIATASEEALKGSDTMIDYAASKAALVNFTKSIASHLAKDGIRANVVAPGPTWTVLNVADQNMPEEGLAQLGSEGPLGRVAQPEEMAPAYVYLASDADSSYTVGEIIAVTGGLTGTR